MPPRCAHGRRKSASCISSEAPISMPRARDLLPPGSRADRIRKRSLRSIQHGVPLARFVSGCAPGCTSFLRHAWCCALHEAQQSLQVGLRHDPVIRRPVELEIFAVASGRVWEFQVDEGVFAVPKLGIFVVVRSNISVPPRIRRLSRLSRPTKGDVNRLRRRRGQWSRRKAVNPARRRVPAWEAKGEVGRIVTWTGHQGSSGPVLLPLP
eukprot:scaffold1954_cov268-Pinguiococcus_pyrenoidosus.AAC.69